MHRSSLLMIVLTLTAAIGWADDPVCDPSEMVKPADVLAENESQIVTEDGISLRPGDLDDTEIQFSEVKAGGADKEAAAEAKAPAAATGLDALIQEALSSNSELDAARQDEFIHRGKSHYERKDWFPKLAAYHTYDSQPDTKEPPKNPASQTDRTWRKAYGVTAEQLIFDWGETRGKVHRESHEAESYAWKAKVKEAEIAYDVAEAYWRAVLFQEVVGLRQQALQAKQKETKSVAERVKANKARTAELRAAEARQAKAEQELLEAQNGLSMSKQRLLYFIGRDVDGDIAVQDTLSADGVSAQVAVNVEAHPDMKRVRSAEMAALSAERSAKAGRLPKLFFRGHIEDSTPEPGADAGNLAPDGYNYQLGVYMSLPLGQQWVGASGRLAEAQATQVQLAAEAKALSAAIKLRVNNAKNKLAEAIKAVEVAQKQKAAADEKLTLTQQMADAKNATQADVAQAEDEQANASIGMLRAIYDVKVAEADLKREMGQLAE